MVFIVNKLFPRIAETAAREAAGREAAGLSEHGSPPPAVNAPPRQNSAEARLQMMQQEENDEGEQFV